MCEVVSVRASVVPNHIVLKSQVMQRVGMRIYAKLMARAAQTVIKKRQELWNREWATLEIQRVEYRYSRLPLNE